MAAAARHNAKRTGFTRAANTASIARLAHRRLLGRGHMELDDLVHPAILGARRVCWSLE